MNVEAKTVLLLGANSDVAKEAIKLYLNKNYNVIAASRDLDSIASYLHTNSLDKEKVHLMYFDAEDFNSHKKFYQELPCLPHIVIYAAGFLTQNPTAFTSFEASYKMINVNYAGALSILNIIAFDTSNPNLERIIGLSSLSGVKGRKSNFIYGSTKAAFTHYLFGLRQELSSRNIIVNALVIGYINTKINAGLLLNQHLIMEPNYVAQHIVNARKKFCIVPNWKWKIIYQILKWSPEIIISKLP